MDEDLHVLQLSHKPAWDRMVARSGRKCFIWAWWVDRLYSETLTFHTDRLWRSVLKQSWAGATLKTPGSNLPPPSSCLLGSFTASRTIPPGGDGPPKG